MLEVILIKNNVVDADYVVIAEPTNNKNDGCICMIITKISRKELIVASKGTTA